MKFLFKASGDPIGFTEGQYVFDMQGYAIAFLEGAHVHRLSGGSYVGELYKDMIVDQYLGDPGSTSSPGDPGRVPPPDNPGNRGAMDYGYPDRSHMLSD